MKRSFEEMTAAAPAASASHPGGAPPPRSLYTATAIVGGLANTVRQTALALIFAGEEYDASRYLGEQPELPGPMAVSMSRRLLGTVAAQLDNYVVCEKSDGERAMLLCLPAAGSRPAAAYLLTRSFDVLAIARGEEYADLLCGPLPAGAGGGSVSQGGPTLLDGELLLRDNDAGSGTDASAVYMIFDAITVRGRAVGSAPFSERMRAIGEEVRLQFRAADDAAAAAGAAAPKRLPLYLLGKFFVKAALAHEILRYISVAAAAAGAAAAATPLSFASGGTAALESAGAPPPHRLYRHGARVNGTDGLVFTPLSPTYVGLFTSGQPACSAPLLKWKWPDEHTVDFRVRRGALDADEGATPYNSLRLFPPAAGAPLGGLPLRIVPLWVATGGGKEAQAGRTLMDDSGLAAYARLLDDRGVDSVIVEAGYDARASAWTIRRVRDRKTRANHLNTAWATLEACAEQLGQAELVAALQQAARGAAAGRA